ncbi:MAG: aldo/keto reductase [Chloroflexi bacterium]|nr:aldo/keto reductase [Chloroflexota bacterium]MCC6895049.1 aldo/keto reductase [Anaerolineae bacterium]
MATLLPTQAVGRTTLQVPRVGFGTSPLGMPPGWGDGEPIAENQALLALQYAFDNGIRFFDSAPMYGKGLAEARTGAFLRQIPREQVVVATKVGVEISGETVQRDYSRDGVLRSLEGSLKRLQVDAVDILHVDDADNDADQVLNETFPALAELRAQGVIKAIGAGMNQWQVPMRFAQHADFDCFLIAGRYTLLEQGARAFFDLCHQKGIAIFAAGIYNSGLLAKGATSTGATYNYKPVPPEIVTRVKAIEAICGEFGVSLHTAATQLPLAHPAVNAILVGFQAAGEVQACLDALQQSIPAALWNRLHEAGLLDVAAPVPS